MQNPLLVSAEISSNRNGLSISIYVAASNHCFIQYVYARQQNVPIVINNYNNDHNPQPICRKTDILTVVPSRWQ